MPSPGARVAGTRPARLIDPADGRGDLRARLVRAVGDPRQRFDEDALRLLRAIRIAARLDFRIEPVTLSAMRSHASDIRWVSEERVGSEVRRMLGADRPSVAFRLLRETGILGLVLPELDALADEPTDDGEDGLQRSLRTLDTAAAMARGRERVALAALCARAGVPAARAALERLRVATRDAEAVATLIEAAATPYTVSWSDAEVRRFMAGLPPELLDDLLVLRGAAAASRSGAAEPEELESELESQLEAQLAARVRAERAAASPLSLAELVIDGRDIRDTLGIPEGPAIGRVLDRLLHDVIEDPSLNRRMTLLTRASLIRDELAEANDDEAPSVAIG